ncbi:MAG: MBL fold metallo-hydrolase [Desulfuromonadales bacterium]
MTIQIDIICENSVGRPIAACGEHGFACLVQTPAGRWLLDTGRGATLLDNLKVLGHDPHTIDGIVLSHGHADHAGGLLPLLREIGPRPVYAHPDIFVERFWQGKHEQRAIGLPYTRAVLEAAGADFHFLKDLTAIAPGVHFSGVIPRRESHESGDPHLVRLNPDSGRTIPDPFVDDAALAIETRRGLVILLGCCHAGLINTIEFFRAGFAEKHLHAMIGGTHLGPADDAQFKATLEYLDRLSFDRLGVSHCTGPIRSAQLYAKFPNKVFFANVGTSLTIA